MAKVYQMAKVRGPDGRLRWARRAKPEPRDTWFLDYVSHEGKRMREASGATTKGEALDLLRKRQSEAARAEIAGIRNPEGLKLTLKEFLKETYLPHVRATKRPGTAEVYARYAAVTGEALGGKLLREITRGDIQDYVSSRVREGSDARSSRKRPLAAATVNRETSFLRSAFYFAMGRDLVDRNPAARLKLLPEENTRTRVMSEIEERKILARAPGFLVPMLRVAVLAGLRRGEILRLRWSDVREGLIHVSPEAKSHKGRAVPITADLETVLDGLDRMVLEGRAIDWLFPDPETGEPWKEWQVAGAFAKAVEAAGIRDLHFHDLRRTFASKLAELGVSLQTIAELLGHGATYVTERYAWLKPDTLRDAVALLSGTKSGRFPADAPILRAAGK